jgi:ABC-type glutathione transport system ATPase component
MGPADDDDERGLSEPERARVRGTEVAYVPQSAAAAKRLIEQGVEVARIHRLMPVEEARARAVELFRALARSPTRRRSASATRTRSPVASCSGSPRRWR